MGDSPLIELVGLLDEDDVADVRREIKAVDEADANAVAALMDPKSTSE